MTKDGIAAMRSKLTNAIFRDEMQQIYERKDVAYSDLVEAAQNAMREMISRMQNQICDSPIIEDNMRQLVCALETTTGKKQYGYLKKPLKQLVDTIVDALAELPEVSECYLKNMRVDFSFYGKPDKQYTIERCAHCKQFRISLDDLIQMFESYGVPRCRIMYENGTSGDLSGFEDTSIFYDMGYTVSQSAGLSAAQRQRILKCSIDTGKASKYDVMRFLRQRMNINGMKAGNEIAFQKWKEDYDFIRSL